MAPGVLVPIILTDTVDAEKHWYSAVPKPEQRHVMDPRAQ